MAKSKPAKHHSETVRSSSTEDTETKIIRCKNCETEFEGRFCPNCGQSIKEFDKPLNVLIVDMAGNIFAFDTRFWRTMAALIIRPGKLTIDYLNGKRARYMPPARLYIFISFIFFILLNVIANQVTRVDDSKREKLDTELNLYAEQLANDSIPHSQKDTLELTGFLPGSRLIIDNPGKYGRKVINAIRRYNSDPGIYVSRFLKFLSWSLFLLMPIFGLILWLFFHKKRKYYYGHLITAINQHAFSFIVLILVISSHLIFGARSFYPENFLMLCIPVYLFIDTKRIYSYRYVGTFFRLFLTLFIYTLIVVVVVAGVSLLWIVKGFL